MQTSFYPLMEDNVTRNDADCLIKFLQQDPLPQFTNGPKVKEFEDKWGKWLGTKHNTMVGSGSMANELSLAILKYLYPEGGEVILTGLGWVSDVAAVLHAGFYPVFVDINLKNLSIDAEEIRKKITKTTRAVLMVHVLGLNGLTDDLVNICREHDIMLIEDCCESHGATFNGQKIGTIGEISNFSYFYAHHLCSLAEGGMICTNSRDIYNLSRSFRSHGMLREVTDVTFKHQITSHFPDLNQDFIFLAPAHNGRSQEVNAVVALNQLDRLDENNKKRAENFNYFISNLDSNKYITNLEKEGNSSYAMIVILKNPSFVSRDLVEEKLRSYLIEFRRGLSGGGSQLRQPYMQKHCMEPKDFPNLEHVSDFGFYIGNYPTLEKSKIDFLLRVLNSLNV